MTTTLQDSTSTLGTLAGRGRSVLTVVARLVLALVFGLSALSKITAPGAFHDSVVGYHLLPAWLVGPFALAIPWLEVLVALYLLIGLFQRPTAIVTALMLVMFTGALSISLIQGGAATARGCGCFSTTGPLANLPLVAFLAGGSTITAFDVVRDLAFIALAGVVYFGDRAALSLDGLLFKPAPAFDDGSEGDEVVENIPMVMPRGQRVGGR